MTRLPTYWINIIFSGIYHSFTGGKQKTTDEYLRGGSTISVLPATISLTISFISTVLILGYPAEMYTFGGQFFLAAFGWALGYFLSGIIYVPVLYPLRTTTSNEVQINKPPFEYFYCGGIFSEPVSTSPSFSIISRTKSWQIYQLLLTLFFLC